MPDDVATHPQIRETEVVPIADLKPHERNYRSHPPDQLEHLTSSLREHGLYRNVVIARDGTLLAGHGVVEAAKAEGFEEIAVVRLDVDPDDDEAIKVLTADNELARLAEVNDRLLSEHLKKLAETGNLLGTGFDEAMLANLIYVTRPSSEIETMNAAAQWVGLPEFGQVTAPLRLVVSFDSVEERTSFLEQVGINVVHKNTNGTLSVWWPPREKEDLSSLRFE